LSFERFEKDLIAALAGPLPGVEGQQTMAPRPRFGWRPGEIPADARCGGVLLLLYPVDDATRVLLTVRDERLPQHAGQVSLPGGAVEPEESIDEAALREAWEEVGLEPGLARVVGRLSPLHVPASRFVLHPRVALVPQRPTLRPDRREVARILEPALATLARPEALAVETREFRRVPVEVPYFRVGGEKVWGATAMVLAELLCLLGSPPDPWSAQPRP